MKLLLEERLALTPVMQDQSLALTHDPSLCHSGLSSDADPFSPASALTPLSKPYGYYKDDDMTPSTTDKVSPHSNPTLCIGGRPVWAPVEGKGLAWAFSAVASAPEEDQGPFFVASKPVSPRVAKQSEPDVFIEDDDSPIVAKKPVRSCSPPRTHCPRTPPRTPPPRKRLGVPGSAGGGGNTGNSGFGPRSPAAARSPRSAVRTPKAHPWYLDTPSPDRSYEARYTSAQQTQSLQLMQHQFPISDAVRFCVGDAVMARWYGEFHPATVHALRADGLVEVSWAVGLGQDWCTTALPFEDILPNMLAMPFSGAPLPGVDERLASCMNAMMLPPMAT